MKYSIKMIQRDNYSKRKTYYCILIPNSNINIKHSHDTFEPTLIREKIRYRKDQRKDRPRSHVIAIREPEWKG